MPRPRGIPAHAVGFRISYHSTRIFDAIPNPEPEHGASNATSWKIAVRQIKTNGAKSVRERKRNTVALPGRRQWRARGPSARLRTDESHVASADGKTRRYPYGDRA